MYAGAPDYSVIFNGYGMDTTTSADVFAKYLGKEKESVDVHDGRANGGYGYVVADKEVIEKVASDGISFGRDDDDDFEDDDDFW
jgi:hypothetical protein